MTKNDEDKRLLQFLNLYNKNYRRMFLFTKTLLPSTDIAEDVLQNASLVLWKKFDSFQSDSDNHFLAWAFRTIHLEALYWRRKEGKRRQFFSEEFLEEFSQHLQLGVPDRIDERYETLLECSQELLPKMKDLLFKRYLESWDVEMIAAHFQSTVETVYKQLSRLRTRLRNCVIEKMKMNQNEGSE